MIDEFISVCSDKFNKKTMKKVLYNRYFVLLTKNKLFGQVFNKYIFNKVFHWNNLFYIIWHVLGV